jgi:hypothetical protein
MKKYLQPVQALKHLWIYPKLTPANFVKYLGAVAEWVFLMILAKVAVLSNALHGGNRRLESQPIQIKEIAPLLFTNEFDKIWEKSHESLRIAVAKTKEYLNWRYTNPRGSYIGLRADENNDLRGYCVLSYTWKGKQKIAWIVDLLAETPELTFHLILEAVRRARQDRADVILMWGNGVPQDIFRRSGFGRSWWRPVLTVDHINVPEVPANVVRDISNWYLTVADIDDSS